MNPPVIKIFERFLGVLAEALINIYEAGEMSADGILVFEALIAMGEG